MNHRGFTLLEVLLALGVLAVLVAGLAGISTASLRLSRSVMEAQQEESVRDGFERLLRENLTEMASDATVQLVPDDSTGGQQLIIGSASGMFPIASVALVTDSIVLVTGRDRAGRYGMDIVYYDGDYWTDLQDGNIEDELMVTVPLRDDFDKLEWAVYDIDEDEWFDEWEEASTRPFFLQLNYRLAGDLADSRMIVWLANKQATNAAPGGQEGAGGQEGGGGQGGGANRPGGSVPTVDVPGRGGGGGNTPRVRIDAGRGGR